MAAGYYDAQGVWMNGEDDAYATFSERLNKSPESISRVLETQSDVLERFGAMQVGTAAMASGWTPGVRWVRVGPIVVAVVTTERQSGATSFTLGAWSTNYVFATGLPPASQDQFTATLPSHNLAEAPVIGLMPTPAGEIRIMPRFNSRTFGPGTWINGTIFYISEA